MPCRPRCGIPSPNSSPPSPAAASTPKQIKRRRAWGTSPSARQTQVQPVGWLCPYTCSCTARAAWRPQSECAGQCGRAGCLPALVSAGDVHGKVLHMEGRRYAWQEVCMEGRRCAWKRACRQGKA
eukprot:751815-Pelagomonas_calceolata.AAC.1